MTDHPVISIFMPVYNGGAYLHESITSVLSQTFGEFELVCVDDSSTDESYSILQEYAKKDNRVIVLQKPNGGIVPKSWNYAMPYLRGDFISYMSQDDLMSPDNLEANCRRYRETGADIVVPDMVRYYGPDRENPVQIGVDGDRSTITGREAFVLSLSWRIHGFIFCKSALIKSEPFNEESINSDEFVTRRCYLSSEKVAFSSGKFYFRRNNPKAITKVFTKYTVTSVLTDQRLIALMENNRIDPSVQNAYQSQSFRTLVYIAIKWYDVKKNYDSISQYAARALIQNHLGYLRSRAFYKVFPMPGRLFMKVISSHWILFKCAFLFARLYKKAVVHRDG